jgi:hypothetical protein
VSVGYTIKTQHFLLLISVYEPLTSSRTRDSSMTRLHVGQPGNFSSIFGGGKRSFFFSLFNASRLALGFLFTGYRMSWAFPGGKAAGPSGRPLTSLLVRKLGTSGTTPLLSRMTSWRIRLHHDPELIFSYFLKIVKFVKHFWRTNFEQLYYIRSVRCSGGTVSDMQVVSSVHSAFKMDTRVDFPPSKAVI